MYVEALYIKLGNHFHSRRLFNHILNFNHVGINLLDDVFRNFGCTT